jgi:glycosyltransferase involved in cell wall biosynthesis
MSSTMKGPFFSVVIPAYNAEAFICDTLNSVSSQKFTDYEIIVVDDGSKDGTYEKVNLWAEQHSIIKLKIVKQANKGIGGARNTAIRHANGVFVAFLDADDAWLEQKLEFIANYIKANPSADLICHDIWFQSHKDGKKLMRFGPHTTYKDLLFKGNSISTSATVVRRQKILDVDGFSEDMRFNAVEDYDLWLRLAWAGCRIKYLHEILSIYRDLGQGISNNIPMHNQHVMNVLEAHFQKWQPKNLYYRYLYRRHRGSEFRAGGYAFMKHRNYSEAKKYFILALKQDFFNWKTWVLAVLNIVRINKINTSNSKVFS